jgi:hypothetical protein
MTDFLSARAARAQHPLLAARASAVGQFSGRRY